MSRPIPACVLALLLASGCGSRVIIPTENETSDPTTPPPLEELQHEKITDDSYCSGTSPRITLEGKDLDGIQQTGTGMGYGTYPLSLRVTLASASERRVTYSADIWFDASLAESPEMPVTVDLGDPLPLGWHLAISRYFCSAGGTDACQFLGSLTSDQGDRLSGWVKLEGANLQDLDRVTICLSGAPAAQPTHEPLMNIRLYATWEP